MKETVAQGRAMIEIDKEGIATFTVCRPRRRNALDLETIEALEAFIKKLEVSPHLCAAIVTGAGDSFIAGGDLKQFSALRGAQAGMAMSRRVSDLLARFEDLPQITIAAMNGDAYGGGCEMALACDLRVLQEGAAMVFSQARFGLTSGWGGTMRLVRLIGYSRALDIFLTQRRLGTAEALSLGLINRVAPPGQILTVAREQARQIGALGPGLVTGIKRVARAAVTSDQEDALTEERRIFASLWGEERHEQLVAQFLADRKKRKD